MLKKNGSPYGDQEAERQQERGARIPMYHPKHNISNLLLPLRPCLQKSPPPSKSTSIWGPSFTQESSETIPDPHCNTQQVWIPAPDQSTPSLLRDGLWIGPTLLRNASAHSGRHWSTQWPEIWGNTVRNRSFPHSRISWEMYHKLTNPLLSLVHLKLLFFLLNFCWNLFLGNLVQES